MERSFFDRPGDTTKQNSYRKELMFEKALTPSDVGKLNRLVVPKQYAERYFPVTNADSGETMLSFDEEDGDEDVENHKSWRFRYSYWTSSQSYVLTKGWSRFVKEKGLLAGDVVSFHRRVVNGRCVQLLISRRRRSSTTCTVAAPPQSAGGGRGTKSKILRLFGVNLECPMQEADEEAPIN